MYYVAMTDTFMSGWGLAQNKINRLVFECETYEDAIIVYHNAKERSEQTDINIRETKPHYNEEKYYTQFKNKTDAPKWYVNGGFKPEK